jgi:SAM-dependent methyltransferase
MTKRPGMARQRLSPGMTTLTLRDTSGNALPLDPDRWHGPTTPAEDLMLAMLRGPVLDVGCGPGRIVASLARGGTVALGVDPAPGAVSLANQHGFPVLQRSVFGPLPGEGRWRSVLLLDGNIGIGGDPMRLLSRCRTLMHRAGRVVDETDEWRWFAYLACAADRGSSRVDL